MSEELKGTPTPKQGMFTITTETKDKNNSPLLVATEVTGNPQFPNGWKFPITKLVNVICTPEFEKKDKSKVPILSFIFRDSDGRQYTHIEWEVERGDEKFTTKLEGLQVRVKHIYTSIFGTFPQNGIGASAANFTDFFREVADAFNAVTKTEGEGETAKQIKVYARVPVYTKVVYYKKNLGFPLSPNFLERVVDGQPCKTLTINTSYDELKPSGGGKSGGGIPGMGDIAGDDLPAFESGYN